MSSFRHCGDRAAQRGQGLAHIGATTRPGSTCPRLPWRPAPAASHWVRWAPSWARTSCCHRRTARSRSGHHCRRMTGSPGPASSCSPASPSGAGSAGSSPPGTQRHVAVIRQTRKHKPGRPTTMQSQDKPLAVLTCNNVLDNQR